MALDPRRSWLNDSDDLNNLLAWIRPNLRDRPWLREHEIEVHDILRRALAMPATFVAALDILIAVVNVTVNLENHDRWYRLLVDVMPVILSGKPDIRLEIQQMLNYQRTLNDSAGETRATIAEVLIVGGEIGKAQFQLEGALERAMQILHKAEKKKNPPEDIHILREIKLGIYIGFFKTETFRQGGYFKNKYIEDAFRIAHRLGDFYYLAWLYQALSGVYTHRGDLTMALQYGSTALGYFHQQAQHHPEMYRLAAKSALILGGAYRIKEQYDLAQKMLRFGLRCALIAPSPDMDQVATLCYELAGVALHKGDYEGAHEALLKAQVYFNKLQAPYQQAMVFHSLGVVNIELGRFTEAEINLNAATVAWDKLKSPVNRVGAQRDRGYLEEKRGAISAAIEYWAEALAMVRKLDASIPYNQMMADWLTDKLRKYGFSDDDLSTVY